MAGHQLAMDPGDAVGKLPGDPDDRARVRPARDLGPRVPARRGRGARLHRRRRRIGDRDAPDRDDPRRTPPSCSRARTSAPAPRPAQGDQRGGRRGGRARRALARRDPAGAAVAALARACRSATSARSSRRSATRRGSPATPACSPSTRARRSAGRSPRRTSTPSSTLRAITLDPAIEQELATSITQTSRRRVPGDGARRGPRPWSPPCEASPSRPPRAAPGRCCSARRASAATCAGWSSRRVPHLPVCSYNEDRPRHQCRDHRSGQRMSTPSRAPSPTAMTSELAGVRTYRGRTLEELLPQIRDELGPDAIILRQREGLIGGVGGFFAQKLRRGRRPARSRAIDVYDDDQPVSGWELPGEEDSPFPRFRPSRPSRPATSPRRSPHRSPSLRPPYPRPRPKPSSRRSPSLRPRRPRLRRPVEGAAESVRQPPRAGRRADVDDRGAGQARDRRRAAGRSRTTPRRPSPVVPEPVSRRARPVVSSPSRSSPSRPPRSPAAADRSWPRARAGRPPRPRRRSRSSPDRSGRTSPSPSRSRSPRPQPPAPSPAPVIRPEPINPQAPAPFRSPLSALRRSADRADRRRRRRGSGRELISQGISDPGPSN